MKLIIDIDVDVINGHHAKLPQSLDKINVRLGGKAKSAPLRGTVDGWKLDGRTSQRMVNSYGQVLATTTKGQHD